MKAFLFYAVHAICLASGLWLLHRRHAAGRLERVPLVAAAIAAATLGVVMFFISEPQQHFFEDFTDAYYAGGAAVLAGASDAQEFFQRGVHGFVNLPVVAYLFVPFALMPVKLATAVFTVLGVAAAVAAWWVLVRAAELDVYRASLLGLLFVLDGPLMNSLREGNTSHFVLLALALALTKLRDGRDWTAGLVLGVATIFKLPLLVFGAYFALRLRLRAAVAQGLVIAITGLVSVLIFGLEAHVAWYERFVAGAGKNPIGAFNVQSVAGFVARLQRGNAALCDWDGHALEPAGRAVVSLTVGVIYLTTLGAALWPRRGAPGEVSARPRLAVQDLEFTIVVLLACITSPLAWSHYYCWMLLPIAFLLAPRDAPAGRGTIWFVTWAAILIVVPPVALPGCAPSGVLAAPYRLLVSHYLFGGLLIWFLFVRERFQSRYSGPRRIARS